MATKRIGILTGGGDVPGLNSVIKEVTYRATENCCEVFGIRRGWEGLTHVNLDDPESKARYVLPLTRENTRTIDRYGGTVLHSSRTNPVQDAGAAGFSEEPRIFRARRSPRAGKLRRSTTSARRCSRTSDGWGWTP